MQCNFLTDILDLVYLFFLGSYRFSILPPLKLGSRDASSLTGELGTTVVGNQDLSVCWHIMDQFNLSCKHKNHHECACRREKSYLSGQNLIRDKACWVCLFPTLKVRFLFYMDRLMMDYFYPIFPVNFVRI